MPIWLGLQSWRVFRPLPAAGRKRAQGGFPGEAATVSPVAVFALLLIFGMVSISAQTRTRLCDKIRTMRTFLIGIALGILTFLVFVIVLIIIPRNGPTGRDDSAFEDPLHSALPGLHL
jgi:hypothetical protein